MVCMGTGLSVRTLTIESEFCVLYSQFRVIFAC